ncbi:YhcH/YjgK/YiaL family protein [Coraliomargarita sp. SDUM461004]|uniref:YhcH/YjgK/YiaL family protein n=1 Tax=Thalassobacterium sedimentorum TaxID=3041258 RepID=A0ABU1AF34_9BACT|nr:YhcH/YjgK/YiaL family protein [Coraliomargarita sp. SDUM461004]MDQ8193289.1 YhcH/YjgK/YiaL family protein [Coraliomargarita sp. SDUM461004]
MLYGKLDTPSTYLPLLGHPIWEEALNALRQLDAGSPLGVQELRGKDMFINVHTYDTLIESDCRFEGHRDMIDVQYIIQGGEYVDWMLKSELLQDGSYQEATDFQYYKTPTRRLSTRVHLRAGYFAIFFPEDGHRPQLSDGVAPSVYKAVVKINRALLD